MDSSSASGVVDLLARLELLRQVQIQAGLRLVDVGSGARACDQRLARGIQVGQGEGLLAQDQLELVLRQQRLQIGASDPYPQVLPLLLQRGLGIGNQMACLLEREQQRPAVDRLAQLQGLVEAVVRRPRPAASRTARATGRCGCARR